MSDVTSAKHSTRTPGLWAAWSVLVAMGGTSVTYNVWHATHGGHMPAGLALLYGLAPVLAAILLSHIVAEYDGGWFLQGSAFVIMLAAMSLSAYATAVTVAPAAGPYFAWVFGLTLDAAALVALRVILASRSRKAEVAAAIEGAHAEAAAARVVVQQARTEAAAAEGERARLAEELAVVRAELEAERQRASARKPKRRPARKPAGISARASGPASAGISGPASGAEDDDLDAEAAALKLWMADRTIPGSQLGPMVGRTDSWGRGAVRKFKQTAPDGMVG